MREPTITSALLRARSAGNPASLTDVQWQRTIAHFDNLCAFCGLGWEVVAFVLPLENGGGAVQGNCVPACRACCRKRKGRVISKMLLARGIPEEAKDRLRVIRAWARSGGASQR